jgi:ABC-type bacteriocin/lantibiotic exporter with double-glycine peptidase domain
VNYSVLTRHAAVAVLFCISVVAENATGVWLDVPYVKQSPEGCGAASIAMIMQYWFAQDGRVPDDQAEAAYILRSLHSRAGHGIYASAMSQYLQGQGFRTFSFVGDWNLLQQHLRQGRPLIVALKPSALDRTLHYVVIAGMDSQREFIMMNDPAERKLRQLDRATFEKQWGGARRWTLLAVPQQSDR